MTELCELARNLEFTLCILLKYRRDVPVLAEAADFYENLRAIVKETKQDVLSEGGGGQILESDQRRERNIPADRSAIMCREITRRRKSVCTAKKYMEKTGMTWTVTDARKLRERRSVAMPLRM